MDKHASRNITFYGFMRALSSFGFQFQNFAVTSLTWAATRSTFATGLQMAVNSLPFILFARFAGPVADRHDPRKVMAVGMTLQAIVTLGYIWTRSFYVYSLLNFIVSTIAVFIVAANAQLIPALVGKENIFKANARLRAIYGGVQLLGPGIAGVTLMYIGPTWAFIINAVSFLFPAAALLIVKPVEAKDEVSEERKESSGFAGAFRFVFSSPAFLLMLGLFGIYTVGMWAVNALYYPYVADVLHAGTDVMGYSVSTYFGAFLIMGLAMERWGEFLKKPMLLPIGAVAGGLVWIGYTLTRSIPVAIVLSGFDGIVYAYTQTRVDTLVQEEAPADARGRVGALVGAWEEIGCLIGQLGGGAVALAATINGGIQASAWTTVGVVVLLVAFTQWRGRRSPKAKPELAVEDAAEVAN